jgi:5'-nucleotidase / UDP-sugar diphosphatase
LAANTESAELIVLDGPEDIGRVRICEENAADLRITYPVKTTIILLHDNDQHFNFNHMDQFTAVIDNIRNEYSNVYLLNAGDIFIRSPEQWDVPTRDFYEHHAFKAVELMNNLNYDVMTLGNHELNYINSLTRRALEGARFPLLGANIEVTTRYLPQPLPYTVLMTDNDISIAVLGLSTVNFEQEGVRSRSPIETAKEYRYLSDKHDIFVALTHIGYNGDRRLAEEIGFDVIIGGIDTIIGGHSHTLLTEAELVNGVLIAQAGGTAANRPNSLLGKVHAIIHGRSIRNVDPQRPKYLGQIKIEMENERVVHKEGIVRTFTSDQ